MRMTSNRTLLNLVSVMFTTLVPRKNDILSKMIDVGFYGRLRRFRPQLLESDGDGEKELDNAEGQVLVLFPMFYDLLQWSVILRLVDVDSGTTRT
jgi:hypothetical protein